MYISTSEAQKRAFEKHIKNTYDELKIRVPKGKKEQIKDAAKSIGMSVNAFAIEAINEKIEAMCSPDCGE